MLYMFFRTPFNFLNISIVAQDLMAEKSVVKRSLCEKRKQEEQMNHSTAQMKSEPQQCYVTALSMADSG